MNYRAIAHVFGTLLLVTAAAMLFPAICALFYPSDDDLPALIQAALLTGAAGFPLWYLFRDPGELGTRDAIFIAAFGWIVISAVSALPFVLHGAIPSFTDAFFEMMSGYTTTGATILTDIEAVPHGLLFWRSETHLLGGMGFITLAVLVMPHGMGGVRMFRAESSPGQVITGEKFLPRNRDAMVYLWGIYLALNAVQVVLQCLGGMNLFESLCHAFGTISTSGYSPLGGSIGQYESAYFDWIIIVFMWLGGVTFMLFYALLHGDWRTVLRNTELRWYVGFTLFFCLGVAAALFAAGTYGPLDSLRFASFQVISLLTTTGFSTADYELWSPPAQMLLYAVCFVGACAGSTTSGIKVIHYVILWRFMTAALKKIFFQPLAIISVRVDERPVDNLIVYLAVCYFIVNIVMVLMGGMVMAVSDGMDLTTAMSSVIACLMNIGPGFGDVGPTENFAFISPFGKWFLSWTMLVGRLEMFTALVVFYPSFWRD
ncbi:MAG: TrkH family potassium uptake protein [Deltaproteobacteria bacterium]|nr:TrkH family potassium uptake protein [Deltaproteobacteria bacterium]